MSNQKIKAVYMLYSLNGFFFPSLLPRPSPPTFVLVIHLLCECNIKLIRDVVDKLFSRESVWSTQVLGAIARRLFVVRRSCACVRATSLTDETSV